ncbi:hypothetical protein HMSSN139_63780 [Paenibacillus sp. HMSSN-139]|nr:hypothetical protein HMSSN139_63780 [Paenibacillus sp. HMSSN-139]
MTHFGKQRPVGRDVDFESFFLTDVEQLVDLGMQQRLALYVKINIVRMRFDIVQDLAEILDFDKLRLTMGRRAETAGQVANAGRFDVKLF